MMQNKILISTLFFGLFANNILAMKTLAPYVVKNTGTNNTIINNTKKRELYGSCSKIFDDGLETLIEGNNIWEYINGYTLTKRNPGFGKIMVIKYIAFVDTYKTQGTLKYFKKIAHRTHNPKPLLWPSHLNNHEEEQEMLDEFKEHARTNNAIFYYNTEYQKNRDDESIPVHAIIYGTNRLSLGEKLQSICATPTSLDKKVFDDGEFTSISGITIRQFLYSKGYNDRYPELAATLIVKYSKEKTYRKQATLGAWNEALSANFYIDTPLTEDQKILLKKLKNYEYYAQLNDAIFYPNIITIQDNNGNKITTHVIIYGTQNIIHGEIFARMFMESQESNTCFYNYLTNESKL